MLAYIGRRTKYVSKRCAQFLGDALLEPDLLVAVFAGARLVAALAAVTLAAVDLLIALDFTGVAFVAEPFLLEVGLVLALRTVALALVAVLPADLRAPLSSL